MHRCGEFLANGDLAQAHYPTGTKVSEHWFRFSFPRGYNADILEAKLGLDAAGYGGDERLRPAADSICPQEETVKARGPGADLPLEEPPCPHWQVAGRPGLALSQRAEQMGYPVRAESAQGLVSWIVIIVNSSGGNAS